MRPAGDGTLVAGLALAETVSWGVLYYAFGVFLQPMQDEMGWSRSAVTAAFSLAMTTSALAAPIAGWMGDRGWARGLTTAGAAVGAALVAAWSQVASLASLYLIWAALGVVMAAVLYEPAFAVIARRFERPQRHRALATVTLVAGLASTIFVPLAATLLAAWGWRGALLILACILALVTVPTHALVLSGAASAPSALEDRAGPRGPALLSGALWTLATAFTLASFVASAIGVHAVAYFSSRGYTAAEGAALVAALGFMQLPARLLFVPLASRLPTATLALGSLLLPAAGLACLVTPLGTAGVLLFVAAFGMGNGLATLTRATVVAAEFGASRYGTVAGILAAPVTAARAAGPVVAALLFDAKGSYALAVPVLLAVAVAAVVIATAWAAGRRHRQGRAHCSSCVRRPDPFMEPRSRAVRS